MQKKKNIYLAFINLEKAFDRVPRRILWWAMRNLRINEWIIQINKSIYYSTHSKVSITNSYSNQINISVGVHQGSMLSPLLFIIVMKDLTCEFRTGCTLKLLYADDLIIIAELLGELKVRLKNWKDGLEEKGPKVNVGKTKGLCSRHDVSKLKITSAKVPCDICMKGVGVNSILPKLSEKGTQAVFWY